MVSTFIDVVSSIKSDDLFIKVLTEVLLQNSFFENLKVRVFPFFLCNFLLNNLRTLMCLTFNEI